MKLNTLSISYSLYSHHASKQYGPIISIIINFAHFPSKLSQKSIESVILNPISWSVERSTQTKNENEKKKLKTKNVFFSCLLQSLYLKYNVKNTILRLIKMSQFYQIVILCPLNDRSECAPHPYFFSTSAGQNFKFLLFLKYFFKTFSFYCIVSDSKFSIAYGIRRKRQQWNWPTRSRDTVFHAVKTWSKF